MKLVKCYECGNKNSPRAATCPQCGAPNRPPQKSDGRSAKKSKTGGLTGIEWMIILAIISVLGAIALPAYNDYQQVARSASQQPGSAIAESDPDDGSSARPPVSNGSGATTSPPPRRTMSNQAPAPTRSSVNASGEIQTESCAGKSTGSEERSHRYWEVQCLGEPESWSSSNPPRVVVAHAPVACRYLSYEARKKFSPYYGAWNKIQQTEGKRYEAGLEKTLRDQWAKKGRTFKRVQCTNRYWVTRDEAESSFELIKKVNHVPPHNLVELLDFQY